MDSDWTRPFYPDEHTVALYHFDEGDGNEAYDACGDPELTLRVHSEALWCSRPGFGTTTRFDRRTDNANVLVGPIDNDKLELRGCPTEWTIEAWVRSTASAKREDLGYRNICGTDDEGVGMSSGVRGGWNFCLIARRINEDFVLDRGIVPHARYMGSYARAPSHDVNQIGLTNCDATINDEEWHHVAWQFRYLDQTHFMFLDGELVCVERRPGGRSVCNDAPRCDLPFVVGGFLHSPAAPENFRSNRPVPNYGNLKGEIDELRISDVMRYPVTSRLTVVHQDLPDACLRAPYSARVAADGARGQVAWKVCDGNLPSGLELDGKHGTLQGTPSEAGDEVPFTVRATDDAGRTHEEEFTLSVRRGRIATESLPVAFLGHDYLHTLTTRCMTGPVRWFCREGNLPAGMVLESTGTLSGTPGAVGRTALELEVRDAIGETEVRELELRVAPAALYRIGPDEHTVALWDLQGPEGKIYPDLMGDAELTLTWTNLKGDTRLPRHGWGRYPYFIGGGEGGFVGPQANPKIDLRICKDAWTVEVWLRRGCSVDGYGREFHFGHICGTYDNSERGVWELYLSDQAAPDGSTAPGVHFFGAEADQVLRDMHPWIRPEGIVADPSAVGIRDTEWHHVAWQYGYSDDLHQIFIDGELIWQMASPDGRRLVNNRIPKAQFSVSSRLTGFSRYGGGFNWLGSGNFYGQIGEISSVRRNVDAVYGKEHG